MGYDSIEPFLSYDQKGAYILCKTSNSGSEDFQDLTLKNGNKLYEYIAKKSSTWGSPENLGFVIGATYPDELLNMRRNLPDFNFLIPGIGEQGGAVSEVVSAVNNNGKKNSFLVNSSRSILYASENKDDFFYYAREKCIELRNKINEALK